MLMASKMVDGQQHSPSTSIIWISDLDLNKDFVIVMSVNFISVSCISRDNYSYELETRQLFYFYE